MTTRVTSPIYSRLSLSRNRRDPQKHFEISVLRHIRFVVLKEKQFEQPNFTNDYVNWLHLLEIYIENIVEKGRNFSSFPQYFVTWF